MAKHWCRSFIVFFALLMAGFGGLTIVIDPYFHYHKPLESLEYRIYNERYQNDGIVKHFDYDALITGTSMIQNFKTSEMDALFGTHSIKIPFSGAAYKEVSENIERAISANSNLKTVVWGLDYNRFYGDFNATRYESYPTYLYDDNPFNDVNYFFNKSVAISDTFKNVIEFTNEGGHTTTFDEYNNWNGAHVFGKEAILSQISRPNKTQDVAYSKLNPQNIEQNVLTLVKAHPEIDFYLFWTPYSIISFDIENQRGELKNILKWEKEAIELMYPYKNLHLYSFFDEFDMITDLDNYKDILHYSEDVNSYILESMAKKDHEVTADNYEAYCQNIWDFYTQYDYDSIYE